MTHIIYTLISGLIKVSICLLYLRVFPNIRVICLGTIAFVTAMSVAIILATIFQCSPIDAVYNEQKYENYTCFASIPFWYATAALSLVTDIWILLLPLKTVLGLHLGTRKRVIITGLLSLGSLYVQGVILILYALVLTGQKCMYSQHRADGLHCEIISKLRPFLGHVWDFDLVGNRNSCRYHRC